MLNYIALVKVLLFLWRVITLPMKSSLEHNAMILRDAHAGGRGKPFAFLLVCCSPRSEASCIQGPSETFWVWAQTVKPASPSSSTQECLAPAPLYLPRDKAVGIPPNWAIGRTIEQYQMIKVPVIQIISWLACLVLELPWQTHCHNTLLSLSL